MQGYPFGGNLFRGIVRGGGGISQSWEISGEEFSREELSGGIFRGYLMGVLSGEKFSTGKLSVGGSSCTNHHQTVIKSCTYGGNSPEGNVHGGNHAHTLEYMYN